MGVCAPECWCPLRPKASNPPEARVKDAREPPSVGGLAITPGSCVSPLFTAEATFSLFYFSSFELNSNIEWLFFHHHFAFLKVKSIEFSCFLERPFFSIRKKNVLFVYFWIFTEEIKPRAVWHAQPMLSQSDLSRASPFFEISHLFLKALGLRIRLGGAAQRELVLYSGDYLMKREHSSFLKGLFIFLLLVMKLTLFFEKIQQRRTGLILPGSSEKEILFLQLHRQHQWDNIKYFQILCLYYYI